MKEPVFGPDAADPSDERQPRRRWVTALRRTALAIVVLIAVVLAGLDRFFWQPASDSPGHADAVVVIGGAGPRLAEAEKLVAAGDAPMLVASNSVTAPQGCDVVKAQLKVPFKCFVPVPFTTRGEARYVADLARSLHWHSFILVTSTTQATRARVRFRRCWSGGMRVVTVGVPDNELLHLTEYEVAALGKAEFAERGC